MIYLSDKYAGTPANNASKRMLRAAKVKLTRFEPDKDRIEIKFT